MSNSSTTLPPSTDEQTVPREKWIGLIGMIFGMFMSILDIQIVNSSLQQIQAGLSATVEEITWIQTAYLIAEVIMIPLSGWLARAFSTRYLYFTSCIGFTVMSLACAFAWDLNSMVFFRALQGFFGGAMIPTVFSVLFTAFPRHLQAKLTVLVGLVVTMAPTLGPVLGGYLTENISWHAMFLINVLPGIFVCVTTWFFGHFDEPDFSLLKVIDYPGIFAIILFLGTLQYVLEEGVRHEWFESREILAFTIISAVSALYLIYREWTTPHPIIDIKAFKNLNFSVGCFYSFVLGWGLYTAVYLQPLYLGMIKNLNSLQIGFYIAVTGIFQFFSAPLAATLMKFLDLRVMQCLGLSLFGLGIWLNSFMTNDWGYWDFFIPQMIRGISIMLCFLPINTIALGTLPMDQVKNASGLYNLMRNLGGAIGLAVTNTALQNWTKAHYAHLRENVSAAKSGYFSGLREIFYGFLDTHNNINPDLSSFKILYNVAQREATVLAFNDVLLCISWLFALSLPMVFLLKKVESNPNDPSAGGH